MVIFLLDHTRHILLFQGLFEEQQQGLSCRFDGSEGEVQTAGDGDHAPAETRGSSVLRAGLHEIQGKETGEAVVCLKSLTVKTQTISVMFCMI